MFLHPREMLRRSKLENSASLHLYLKGFQGALRVAKSQVLLALASHTWELPPSDLYCGQDRDLKQI